jgi:hypothetical protein
VNVWVAGQGAEEATAFGVSATSAKTDHVGGSKRKIRLLAGEAAPSIASAGETQRPALLQFDGAGVEGGQFPRERVVSPAKPELKAGDVWGVVDKEDGGGGKRRGSLLGPMETAMLELQAGRHYDATSAPSPSQWRVERQKNGKEPVSTSEDAARHRSGDSGAQHM